MYVRAKGPESVEDATTHLLNQYDRYGNYTTINNAMHPTLKTTEGKVADAVIAPQKAQTYKKTHNSVLIFDCDNCGIKHDRFKNCLKFK